MEQRPLLSGYTLAQNSFGASNMISTTSYRRATRTSSEPLNSLLLSISLIYGPITGIKDNACTEEPERQVNMRHSLLIMVISLAAQAGQNGFDGPRERSPFTFIGPCWGIQALTDG
jgi:hypothetical protein